MLSRRPLLVLAGALVALAGPAPARAASCPGADPCPYTASSVVGDRAGGSFRFPSSIAVDPSRGRVYVGDQFGRDVQVFGRDGSPLGDFGTQGTGDGQFLKGIGGLAVDPATGDVYAVDSGAGRIERFASDGTFLNAYAGSLTFRFGGGTDSDDTAGGGLAVGGGRLWVADTLDNRIVRLDLDLSDPVEVPVPGLSVPEGVGWSDADGGLLLIADNRNDRIVAVDASGTVQAVGGQGVAPDGSPALDQPYDVAADAAGRIFVASDQNSRFAIADLDGQGGFGAPSVFGGFGAGPGQLEYPRALALDQGDVSFLAEGGGNRVQAFDAAGASVLTFGHPGRQPGSFTLPQGIAADPYGDVLVADAFAYRGQAIGADGGVAFQIGSGKLLDRTRDPASQPERFTGLVDLAQEPTGTILALDSREGRLVRYDAQGQDPVVLATGVVSSASGVPEGGVTVDGAGRIWVADAGSSTLKRLDPATGAVVQTIGGPGSGAGQLSRPQGIRADADGDLWVADSANGRIVELGPDGRQLAVAGTAAGAGQLSKPLAVALDGRGHVYVADVAKSAIFAYRTDDGGFVGRFGERGTGQGQFVHPAGVAVDCDGTISVADRDANRVQRFVPADPGPSTCVPRPAVPAPPVVAAPAPVPVPAPAVVPKPRPRAARVTVRLVRAAGALGRRGLAVRLTCAVRCTVLPRATLAPAAGRPRFAVAAGGRRVLQAHRARTVTLRASRATVRSLARRLHRRRALALSLTVRTTRPGAPSTATVKRYRVRR